MAGRLALDHPGRCFRGDLEFRDVVGCWRAIKRIGHGHRADQDQHDEAHTLLSIVGAVGE